jgi:hypothetical protein
VVDEAKLALMLARDELHQLVNCYCRAVDRADYDALRGLYHPSTRGSLRGEPGQADPSVRLFAAPEG